MRIRLPWARSGTRFTGEWSDRLDSLFSCGVDFTGRSILDLGCNMGIVAYEVAKLGPISIHGIDLNRQHIQIARSIFQAVPVESRFDCMSIASSRFEAALAPMYNTVLLLSVYHHLKRGAGEKLAANAMRTVARHCDSTIVIRDPGTTEAELLGLLGESGFSVVHHSDKPARTGRLTVLSR
jgi:2-polyprenyl-3-methyl-5-hydroxy-6-metoxy-1,4-benzoquinol methylase